MELWLESPFVKLWQSTEKLLSANATKVLTRHASETPELLAEAICREVVAGEPGVPQVVVVNWGDAGLLYFELLRLNTQRLGNEAPLFFRDCTERERVLRELARSQAMVELSAEGFTLFDSQANILFESVNNQRITGYPAAEMVGRSFFEFIHPEDTERLAPRFARLAENPRMMDRDIVRWHHRDGHWIYLEGSVINHLDHPLIGGLINTFRNVTHRVEMERALKAAKEAAEAAQSLQQKFLANISHEFRTPLTLVKQPLEELFQQRKDDPRWGIVQRNLRRMDLLMTELIDLSVLDAGLFQLRAREVPVAPFLTDLLAEVEAQAAARAIRLETEFRQPEATAYLDRARFAKAFLNLVGNAIKFGPLSSRVIVRLTREPAPDLAEDALCIEVEDEGMAIPRSEHESIFRRFYQVEGGDRRAAEGMGIGLNLAREAIELHGGEIGLTTGETAGNCFWIRIPTGAAHLGPEDIDVTDTPPQPSPLEEAVPLIAPPVSHAPSPAAPAAARRLLIVEDNADLRRYLSLNLESIYRIAFAIDGAAALDSILRDPPDLVLSDVMMPQLDGVALCEELRKRYTAEELPIILLTAKSNGNDRLRGLQAGANDYLGKPFSMDELRLRMHNLVTKRSGSLKDAADKTSSWTEQTQDLIAEQLDDPQFGVARWADALKLSQRQLQRRCIDYFGETPTQFLQAQRVQRARKLLESGEVSSVTEAAERVAMSPNYLSRRFQAVFKKSPKDFLPK